MKVPRTRRRRLLLTIVIAASVLATTTPGLAGEDDPTPGSCRLHPTHVVNPGCVPALTSELREPGLTYPNVSPDVREVGTALLSEWDPETFTFTVPRRHLQFDSWVMNLGTVPLDLLADDPSTPSTVLQCVSWTEFVCRERRVVGGYVWHEEHGHFHFPDFADYRLLHLGADGRPDYSEAGLIAVSEKVSFCLVDSTWAKEPNTTPPLYIGCGPTRQGVSPGWTDVYFRDTPGQELPIEGLPDGRYALVVTLNSSQRVWESDDTDNVVEITVELSAGGTQAAIVGRHYP